MRRNKVKSRGGGRCILRNMPKCPIPLHIWCLATTTKGLGCPSILLSPTPWVSQSPHTPGMLKKKFWDASMHHIDERNCVGTVSLAVVAEMSGRNLICTSSYCNQLSSQKKRKEVGQQTYGYCFSCGTELLWCYLYWCNPVPGLLRLGTVRFVAAGEEQLPPELGVLCRKAVGAPQSLLICIHAFFWAFFSAVWGLAATEGSL